MATTKPAHTNAKKVRSKLSKEAAKPVADDTTKKPAAVIAEEHLPPLALVFTVLTCSGFLWVLAMRDVLATGRNIAGSFDTSMLLFTRSTEFFDDSRGWKSTQGGLSSIQQISTDANNMGGLFVRKLGGAAALAVHTQKLMPLLFHPAGAMWKRGDFRPMFSVALLGDLAIAIFYGIYMDDFMSAGAEGMPLCIVAALAIEILVIFAYIVSTKVTRKGPAVAMPEGKTPESLTSRIVARTVFIVSSIMTLIAGRDLFFPGKILEFIPRDDIYLEWTNSFLHSPPDGSPEAVENSMSSPLYIGDKFLSQSLGLYIIILSVYKFVSAFWVRFGSDGSGEAKCKMIWKAQAIGNCLLLFLLRMFTPAAQTASLDLRWHLMCVAYEALILGLYGFF